MSNRQQTKMRHYNLSKAAANATCSQADSIAIRRKLSSYAKYRPPCCFYCRTPFVNGKKHGICNSHSIPQFVLRPLTNGRELRSLNSFIKVPGVKETTGLKSAGIFRLLCRECDGILFRNYENPEIYTPSLPKQLNFQIIMNEIAMKDYLYALDDHLKGKTIYEEQLLKYNYHTSTDYSVIDMGAIGLEKGTFGTVNWLDILIRQIKNEDADIVDNYTSYFRTEYIRRRQNVDSSTEDEYTLGYYHLYNRSFPIAFQGKVTVEFDCWGNHINNLLELNRPTQDIHLCIFPFAEDTVIFAFYNKQDNIIPLVFNELSKLSDDDSAKALIAMGLSSSGNLFINSNSSQTLFESEYLKQLCGEIGAVLTITSYNQSTNDNKTLKSPKIDDYCGAKYLLNSFRSIPNSLIGYTS